MLSLISRGQIADKIGKLPGPADKYREMVQAQYDSLPREEDVRARNMASKANKPTDDEDEGEGEDEE